MKTPNEKEFWQVVYDWLNACKIKPNQRFCKEEITTHPEYPSLLSAIDFLDSGGMTFSAVRSDALYIHEFNYPVLAHIKEPGREYMHIVTTPALWDIQKEITQHWSGVVVYPEKSAKWQNSEDTAYKSKALRGRFVTAALIIAGVVIYLFSTWHFLNYIGDGSIFIAAFGIFSLLGLVISIYSLGTELGFQSQVVKQVCGAVGNGGCENVLQSKYAKGFVGITPADASVLYFAAQFVVYLVGCWQPNLLSCIILLAFGGVLIAGWSIYTQAVKLRQWCALCLGIVGVLLIQAVFSAALVNWFTPLFLSGALLFATTFFTLALCLLPIKQLLKTNTANKLKLAELKKWKLDAGLFINQWEQEALVDTTVWENDLLLGSPAAPLLITVACNPYCGPCAKAHIELDRILHQFEGKVKILIRLLTPAKLSDDEFSMAVAAILQTAAITKTNTELQLMLSEWFAWMNYEKWVTKWKPNGKINLDSMMAKHHVWMEQTGVAFTPSFFINGRMLPGRYSLSDFELLIPQLAGLMINEKTL